MNEGVPWAGAQGRGHFQRRWPMAPKAFCSGCTTNGMEYTTEPITSP
jgi:hypothetical protein